MGQLVLIRGQARTKPIGMCVLPSLYQLESGNKFLRKKQPLMVLHTLFLIPQLKNLLYLANIVIQQPMPPYHIHLYNLSPLHLLTLSPFPPSHSLFFQLNISLLSYKGKPPQTQQVSSNRTRMWQGPLAPRPPVLTGNNRRQISNSRMLMRPVLLQVKNRKAAQEISQSR